jgi:hypothetical protein
VLKPKAKKNQSLLVKQVLKNEVTHNPLILTIYRPKPPNPKLELPRVPQEAIYAPESWELLLQKPQK